MNRSCNVTSRCIKLIECLLCCNPWTVIMTGWMSILFLNEACNTSTLWRMEVATDAVSEKGLLVYLASQRLMTLSPRMMTRSIWASLETNPMDCVLTPSMPNACLSCGRCAMHSRSNDKPHQVLYAGLFIKCIHVSLSNVCLLCTKAK